MSAPSSAFKNTPDDFIKVLRPTISEDEIDAACEVLRSGHLVQGERVREFEHQFASFNGAEYCVALNSGTTALHAALLACGIGEGDQVVVPALSFFATAEAVMWANAHPVFCEVDKWGGMDYQALRRLLETRPSIGAVIVVHYLGLVVSEIEKIAVLCEEFEVPLIEDCAMAHGASVNGKLVGTFGNFGCFSFYVTKHLTTIEGGAIITNNAEAKEELVKRRVHGMSDYHTHGVLGHNWRLNEVQAAIGIGQLDCLPTRHRALQARASILRERLASTENVSLLPVRRDGTEDAPFTFTVLAHPDHRDLLVNHLKERKIESFYRYFFPMSDQPIVAKYFEERLLDDLEEQKENLDMARHLAVRFLGLPCRWDLSLHDLEAIIEGVRSWQP